MSSWVNLEGRFDGIIEEARLQDGGEIVKFLLTEEARGAQKAASFMLSSFKTTAQAVKRLSVGASLNVTCKLNSRAYEDKSQKTRYAVELNAVKVWVLADEREQKASAPAMSDVEIPF